MPDKERQAWLSEAQRRAEEIDQGKVELVSSAELEQQVQAILDSPGGQ